MNFLKSLKRRSASTSKPSSITAQQQNSMAKAPSVAAAMKQNTNINVFNTGSASHIPQRNQEKPPQAKAYQADRLALQ